MPILSPYPETWSAALKGNIHTHTTVSDGRFSPQEAVDKYASLGYHFLMFSDHDSCGDVSSLDDRGLILLPGVEVSANGPHILQVGSGDPVEPDPDRGKVIASIRSNGAFAVCNHPNWLEHFNHFPQELLETLDGYLGIEVYNGCIRRLKGSPIASDRWDMLLAKGRKVWGHGVDDSHRPEDYGRAWDVALLEERTPQALLSALANGSFYASTGVEIREIEVSGDTVRIASGNADLILAVGESGRIIGEEWAGEMRFTVPEDAGGYVRFELYGRGDRMAWTQPFFITSEET